VILNGTTSAGKSTLAVELQAQLGAAGECWLVWGIDDFLAKLPLGWLSYDDEGEHADEGIRFDRVDGGITFRAGPIGDRLLASYRGTVAAMAHNGLNVIVDEVVLDEAAWLDWVQCLEALPVLWVRVDCPIDVLEAREQERGDRLPGLARSQLATVHRHPTYDLVVDTAASDAAACAARVAAAVRDRR
jgi:chloramphenicol 3-O phosphotransferase